MRLKIRSKAAASRVYYHSPLAARLTTLVLAGITISLLLLPLTIISMWAANFVGTSGPDTIVGTNDDDKIFGKKGNDNLRGEGGDDYIEGNAGNDEIHD